MAIQILLTAVSYKPHGACIAGITTDGTFIRPGSLAQQDFSIPWESIEVGPFGRKLQPLDVVSVELEPIEVGKARHFEDRNCRNSKIEFVNQLTMSDLRDKGGFQKATKPAWFMDDSAPYVLNADPTRASLALVLAESIEITPKPHDQSKHYISFTAQNRRFQKLSLTDLSHQRLYETAKPGAKNWLCMSLALDYSVEDQIRNYKLVAGMWPAD